MGCPLVDIRMMVGVCLDVQSFKIFHDESWPFVLIVMVEHHVSDAVVLNEKEDLLSFILPFMPILHRWQ